MAELVNSTYVTLDGVIENPQTWPDLGGFGAEGNRIQTDLVLGCSAVLMGRRTYESFAGVWPHLPESPLVDKMNAMPKYVASSTLTAPAWNNSHVLTGDLVDAVGRLKESADDDLVQFGFGDVTRTLLAAGLLDRLRLWVHPILVGGDGPRDVLARAGTAARFDLEQATPLESGIVILDYRARR